MHLNRVRIISYRPIAAFDLHTGIEFLRHEVSAPNSMLFFGEFPEVKMRSFGWEFIEEMANIVLSRLDTVEI